MRRLAPLCLGLALAVPAAAQAQAPHARGSAPAHRQAKAPQTLYAGHLCADCAGKLPKRVPASGPGMPPPVVMHGGTVASPALASAPGGCATCEMGGPALASAPAGYGEAPGLAFVGGEAAGYAAVGGEPAPIGIMRTDYAPAGAGAPAGPGYHFGGPAIDPMHGDPAARAAAMSPGHGMGPGMGDTTFGGATRSRQGKVLANMIGLPTFRPLGAARAERRRDTHAMLSYGSGAGMPSELPASMVYGR